MAFPDELEIRDELELEIKPDPSLRVEYYRDKIGEWRWNLLAGNGETLADSAEGYHNRTDMLEIVDRAFPGVPVAEKDAEADS